MKGVEKMESRNDMAEKEIRTLEDLDELADFIDENLEDGPVNIIFTSEEKEDADV